jgi:DNA-directed RNA polymerase subunit H (RpoH/RPB5)
MQEKLYTTSMFIKEEVPKHVAVNKNDKKRVLWVTDLTRALANF